MAGTPGNDRRIGAVPGDAVLQPFLNAHPILAPCPGILWMAALHPVGRVPAPFPYSPDGTIGCSADVLKPENKSKVNIRTETVRIRVNQYNMQVAAGIKVKP